jgi:P-type Cu2+ transporter
MLLLMMIQEFLGANWQFTGSLYISFTLSTVVFSYAGWPFSTVLVDAVKKESRYDVFY